MAMTDEEILRAAARIRAAQRRKTTKRCPVCGAEFEGIATKRYCSDRCRVQAAREREAGAAPEESRYEERHRLLPTAMLYYGAPGAGSLLADSNGNAAGSSLEDAVLQRAHKSQLAPRYIDGVADFLVQHIS